MDIITKPSSEEVVLNQDDDLLTLILLHVPWKNLKVLKCVSRHWHSLITTPYFRSLLRPPLRASGLFIQRPVSSDRPDDKVYFLPLDDPKTPSPFKSLTFAPQRIRILQSCKGLLLCSSDSLSPPQLHNSYIYNSSTNQLDILPKYPTRAEVEYIGLAFDPSNSPHYKVIAFVHVLDPVGNFHIYSSETKTWLVSVQSFSPGPDMYFDEGIYWKGCVHWLSPFHIKHERASAVPDGLYFNVDEGRLGTFPRPPISVESTSYRSFYFGESEGHLHFTEACPCTTSLSVYEMKSDYSKWFLKYQINLAPISKIFPEMTNYKVFRCRYKFAVDLMSLVRRENFQEDSFLVLAIPGEVIRYNIVDRSCKVLCNVAADLGLRNVDWGDYRELKVWQYIETLSCE
ncbi:F-box protein At5g07610-like [Apium graveolens]|uniref:F-box protein At5g07610-like n=1 Tax=Apium graveolens TaxID=4045 RepID=UPI003D78E8DF